MRQCLVTTDLATVFHLSYLVEQRTDGVEKLIAAKKNAMPATKNMKLSVVSWYAMIFMASLNP